MIQARHPEVANMFLEKLEGWPDTPFLGAAAVSARTLTGTMGFEPPSWRALADGAVQNLRNQMSLRSIWPPPSSVCEGWCVGAQGVALESAAGVVVDGLPLLGGCQLAVDTTLVCALHCDGSPHNGAADADGVVLQAQNSGTSRCACRGGGGQMVQYSQRHDQEWNLDCSEDGQNRRGE